MSNFVIKQEGDSSVVADNIWELRLGAGSLALGALAGAVGGVFVGLYLGRRGKYGAKAQRPKEWPVNLAHRGGAGIAPENTLVGFREGLRAGAGGLELDVHMTSDGHLVVIHDDTVDRTTDGTGPVREMSLPEVKKLDAGYWFSRYPGETYPYRGQGITVPTLEEVYEEFPDVPINIEIKEPQHGIEAGIQRAVEGAGAANRTLVVSDKAETINRFREVAGGRVATASSPREMLAFDLLSRLRLTGLLRPPYQALQGPEFYPGLLRVHMLTSGFVRAAHRLGLRVDVWTVDREQDMRRLLALGVDGIMTDRPDVLARVLQESA